MPIMQPSPFGMGGAFGLGGVYGMGGAMGPPPMSNPFTGGMGMLG